MDMEGSPDHLRQDIDDELKSLEKSSRVLKLRRNALAPISRLPPETLAAIFFFLSLPRDYVPGQTGDEEDSLAWLRVAHVCHQWREIALSQPRFWCHVDITALTLRGVMEVLSRSKMAPLEVEADLTCTHWDEVRLAAAREQLVVHMPHTSRLAITGRSSILQTTVDQLVSPVPSLESLSVAVDLRADQCFGLPGRVTLPPNLFDGSAPRLSRLQVDHCDIDWKSPILRGLRILEIHTISPHARPSLGQWLDAMRQIVKLETLVVRFATPMAPTVEMAVPDPALVLTHPSLTQLHLAASASDCAFALAHLSLPALTRVRVDVISELSDGRDVRALLPYFTRNVHGPQDVEPLRSMITCGRPHQAEIILWTKPDADVEVQNSATLISATLSARAVFTVSGPKWGVMMDTEVVDAILTSLPLSSLSGLTAQNTSHFPETLWLNHAPCWPSLKRVRLVDAAVTRSFAEVLCRDAPRKGPLLPSLTKLSLFNSLSDTDGYRLLNMLVIRMQQGVPLQTVDLRGCLVTPTIVQRLGEIVVDVQGCEEAEQQCFGMTQWPTLSTWTTELALFQREVDGHNNNDGDE